MDVEDHDYTLVYHAHAVHLAHDVFSKTTLFGLTSIRMTFHPSPEALRGHSHTCALTNALINYKVQLSRNFETFEYVNLLHFPCGTSCTQPQGEHTKPL